MPDHESVESFTTEPQFEAYGPSHWTVIAAFVVGAVGLVWFGRRASDARARALSRLLAVSILAVFAVALVYKLIHPDIRTSVPLQLCDIAELVAAYALWTQRHWAFALTYYWGLVLSSQALLTPDIGTPTEGAPDFPHHLFITFFALHVLVVWSAIYLTWGRRMRPGWRDLGFTVTATVAWAAITLLFNVIAGTDYGYLNGKPPTASILDALGPWPAYLFVELTVVIAVWALMTWPWTASRGQRK